MRKVMLILLGLFVTGAGFFLYRLLSPPKRILSTEVPKSEVSIPSRASTDSHRIGGTQIDLVEDSRWSRRDPDTKKVVEVGGFSKLLTPPEGSRYWLVKSPYLIRYEDRFTCRIDAEQGRIQMDQVGDLPSAVELMENVRLEISPIDQKQQDEKTYLYLDTLSYSSERSEFSTDGPVHMVSQRAEIKGRGLILIYNPRTSRMEYLEIRDLDTLLVRDAGGSWRDSRPADRPTAEKKSDLPPAAGAGAPAASEPSGASVVRGEEEPAYYQCSIQNNVMIRYGRELVVVGADQVNIQRILWEGGRGDSSAEAPEGQTKETADLKPAVAAVKTDPAPIPEEPAEIAAAPVRPPVAHSIDTIDREDVLITCDGGIIIQPMEDSEPVQSATAILPSVEMSGQLQIDRFFDAASEERIPLASCSSLRYVLRDEILELFSDSSGSPIQIYLDQAGSMIETLGQVFWDRRTNLARVDGPGKVTFTGDGESGEADRGEVTFDGLMDLEFADGAGLSERSPLALKMVNLTGGMEAVLHDQGLRSRARQALFTFQPSNKPETLDLKGDVHFETDSDGRSSQVQAGRTVLQFDSGGHLQSANLSGQVRMTSAGQTALAESAAIEFAQDSSGRLIPGQVHLQGQSQIEDAGQADVPPSRFDAMQIDYDLQGGNAIAAGPIHFTFWAPADDTVDFLKEPIPVEITAHDHAEFETDGKGAIRQVIFSGRVVAQWKAEGPREQLLRRFFGDRLIVDLEKDPSGAHRIQHVSLQDRKVLFESIHILDGKKVNHVGLTCVQFDYEADGNKITATGPGRLEMNNQAVSSVSQADRPFSLQQPCFAYMEGFDQLVWNLDRNDVRAYGRDSIYLNYWPFESGRPGDQVIVQCAHAQAQFDSAAEGKSELASLTASGGVSYREEKPGGRTLQGDSLTYSRDGGWVVIEGSEARPCKVDTVTVPMIQYQPETGQIKTQLSTSPSVMPDFR